jgi:hypothetical protein
MTRYFLDVLTKVKFRRRRDDPAQHGCGHGEKPPAPLAILHGTRFARRGHLAWVSKCERLTDRRSKQAFCGVYGRLYVLERRLMAQSVSLRDAKPCPESG